MKCVGIRGAFVVDFAGIVSCSVRQNFSQEWCHRRVVEVGATTKPPKTVGRSLSHADCTRELLRAMADEETTSFPQRTITRLHDGTNSINPRVWDELAPHIREGDIVVNTFAKSGTTWMLQLILQMLNNGEETLSSPDNTLDNAVPWIENELTFPNAVADLKSTPPNRRRLIKSHLQLDALLFSPKIRYVCVVRDGRDIALSLHNHLNAQTEKFRQATNQHLVENFDLFFDNFLHRSNQPFSDYFHHIQSWWKHANSCDNILLVNYNEMQRNLADVVLRLAKFLDVHVDRELASERFQNILDHSSFRYMKRHEELFEMRSSILKPGSFIHKGVSGRWRGVLSEAQQQMYWDKVTECWCPDLLEFVHKDELNS